MAGPLSLILSTEPVRPVDLSPRKARRPSVAVVYSDGAGMIDVFEDGKPLPWSGQLFTRYRVRYEVDITEHLRTLALQSSPLPARGDAFHFETVLSVRFMVTDPAQIIRLSLTDGLAVVSDYLINFCRTMSRQFDIQDAAGLEGEINGRFTQPHQLPQGITIHACSARISPDAAARAHLQGRVQSQRSAVEGFEQHAAAVLGAERTGEISLIEQRARLEREHRERLALGDRGMTPQELLRIFLERNPGESGAAFAQLHQYLNDNTAALERQQDRRDDMLRALLAHDQIQPADLHVIRQEAMQQQLGPATAPTWPAPMVTASVSGWETPLPGSAGSPEPAAGGSTPRPAGVSTRVVPVYLMVDQSATAQAYLAELNAGIESLLTTLAGSPRGCEAVRLSVAGYADTVEIRLALQAVRQGIRLPALTPGGSVRLANAFSQLLDWIPQDVNGLKSVIPQVGRPIVFFLAGAQPDDGEAWDPLRAQLLDRRLTPSAPEIVVGGLGDIDQETVARIASRPEYGFIATQDDPGAAARQFLRYVEGEIVELGESVAQGSADRTCREPSGFRVAAPHS